MLLQNHFHKKKDETTLRVRIAISISIIIILHANDPDVASAGHLKSKLFMRNVKMQHVKSKQKIFTSQVQRHVRFGN